MSDKALTRCDNCGIYWTGSHVCAPNDIRVERDELRALLAGAEDALAAAVREAGRLREALERLEEPCPDCDGDGCNWCGGTGFVLRDPAEIVAIRKAALAVPAGEGATTTETR